MKLPANINMPLEEYFCQLRNAAVEIRVLDLPLLKKAKAVYSNEFVGED